MERFENDAFWKRCFLVWSGKTMLSENGDVIKVGTTGRQTTRPWVSKMADRRYHVASISRQFRRPIYWNAHTSSLFDHAHWGYHSVFKQIRRCSVDGRKRYENDKCGRKSFWKRSKTAPFSFENGLVWTGPKKPPRRRRETSIKLQISRYPKMIFFAYHCQSYLITKLNIGHIDKSEIKI